MSKIVFEQSPNEENSPFTPKQHFSEKDSHITPDEESQVPLEGEIIDNVAQSIYRKPRWWKTLLKTTALLFLLATLAQSVQWLLDTYQQHQWIYFAFALVSLMVVLFGIGAIWQEGKRLLRLKKREKLKMQAQAFFSQSAVENQGDFEAGLALCKQITKGLGLDNQHPNIVRWQSQLNEAHTAAEVGYLFSENVLKQIDAQAQQLISRHAAETAILVAISPLAVVDMFFIAWRNLRLINQLARLYGIELGYVSRIRLLRLVLVNMAFAGATEVITDLGMDWLSQDITAKLSARVAQGVGVGLLSARLGLKTQEFCRPIAFLPQEKPRLKQVYRQLLAQVKSALLTREKQKVLQKN